MTIEIWNERRQDMASRVVLERARQLQKWGFQSHDPGRWMMILMEEVGELSKEMLEGRVNQTAVQRIAQEAIQVAAVAQAIAQWVEDGEA